MFVCHQCEAIFADQRGLMSHLRSTHVGCIACLLCMSGHSNTKSYQQHLHLNHPNGNVYGPFLPPNWQELLAAANPPVVELVANPPAEHPAAQQPPDGENGFDFLDPVEGEEEIHQPVEMEPDETFNALFKPYLDSCFQSWLEFLSRPDATIKSAAFLCTTLMENAKATIRLAQAYLPYQQSYAINSMMALKFIPFSTEHKRRQYLMKMEVYAKPEEYLTNIDPEIVGTPAGIRDRPRRNVVAVIPMERTLKCILSKEHIANSMVMPSAFTNNPTLCHPFSGRRAQRLITEIGEDCLFIELYMDEFTTTCPLGNSSSVYKMAAWYFRLLNLPLDMQSMLDHVLLASLAHAVDVMEDLQEILRMTLLPQLKELERDGITFQYQGVERTFKVVLYRLSADNLGFHQLVGLTRCFSGNNPCWMCTETADSLRRRWILDPQKLRNRQQYDHLIANGTPQQRLQYGISANCCFNELRHFHCMEDFSVDYMHDLHEGHFLRLIPIVCREAVAAGYTLANINDAIVGFPLVGDDAKNPLRPIYLPNQIPENGDNLGGYTASNSGLLVRFLPLMFKLARIRLQTPSWKALMKLQRILDILYAPLINDANMDMFDTLVKSYLKDYITLGGKMTVKPHKLLHYKPVMKEMGPLRHMATFRYEAKHQPLKQYAHSNRCLKNLQTTLADKNELMFASTLQKMKAPDYFEARRQSRSLAKFKKLLAVVYGQDPATREPKFGEIYNFDVNTDRLTLKMLYLEEFDESSHCYVVRLTENVIEVAAASLVCPEPVSIYRKSRNYIRMPYFLP